MDRFAARLERKNPFAAAPVDNAFAFASQRRLRLSGSQIDTAGAQFQDDEGAEGHSNDVDISSIESYDEDISRRKPRKVATKRQPCDLTEDIRVDLEREDAREKPHAEETLLMEEFQNRDGSLELSERRKPFSAPAIDNAFRFALQSISHTQSSAVLARLCLQSDA